ncbi:hypothetical protein BH09SUM1_BH09SUM1_14230 [soil metagenome]
MKAIEKRIAARLLSVGALSEPDLERALFDYDGTSTLSDLLRKKGVATPAALCRAEAEANGLQFVDLNEVFSTPEAIATMTAEQAWQDMMLPIWLDGASLTVAVADPNNFHVVESLKAKRGGSPVVTLVAERGDMETALGRYYGAKDAREKARAGSRDAIPVATHPYETSPSQMATATRIDSETHVAILGEETQHNFDDPNDRVSSSEVSHREFQRRARALRDQDEIPGVSQAQTQFLESSDSTLSRIEAGRAKRGAYEAPRDAAALEKDNAAAGAHAMALRTILEEAVELRAQEIEFAATPTGGRNRYRIGNRWTEPRENSSAAHAGMIGRLRLLAGLELRPRDVAAEHQFILPVRKGSVLCTLFIEPARDGDRAVVRMSEHIPLLENPMNSLGLPSEVAGRINARLSGRGGGLLFISSADSRTSHHIFQSLLKTMAKDGTRDVLSLERGQDRRLAGVTAINCPNDEVLLASLANAGFMNPDVLAISSVENGTVLNRIVNVSMRGTTALACFTAPSAAIAQTCFRAAKIDAMNLARGVIGHLHVEEHPRLCPKCMEPIAALEQLPEWARAIEDTTFVQAKGCRDCGGTGRQGNVFIAEFFEPAPDKGAGAFVRVVPRSDYILNFALTGEIDIREFPSGA